MLLERNGKTVTYQPVSIDELADLTANKAKDMLEAGDVALRIDGSAIGEDAEQPNHRHFDRVSQKLSSNGISFSLHKLGKNFRSTLRVSRVDTLLTVVD